jgi:putative oxygen-independent coproporphyrinogen III oxidase
MSDLSIYLHIPFCRHRCSYCSFTSYEGRESEIPRYVSALEQELKHRTIPGARVKTIYFGGGTPSLLPLDAVRCLLTTIDEYFVLEDNAEITLEANPGTISPGYLRELRNSGINRLSLGVQSFNDEELKLLGRIHSADEARHAVETARHTVFQNISLDFIYGIPGRTLEIWQRILNEAIKFDMPHLSLYGLTVEENTPMHSAIECDEMLPPNPDTAANEYELAEKLLGEAGYRHYEISNWAKPGYESRHNLVYWKRGEYLGVGVAAHSFIGGKRIANTAGLDDYLATIGRCELLPQTVEEIIPRIALSESIMLGLRLDGGVSSNSIRTEFGVDLYGRFKAEIDECVSLGLLDWDGEHIRLTPRGRLLGNEVFIRFLS